MHAIFLSNVHVYIYYYNFISIFLSQCPYIEQLKNIDSTYIRFNLLYFSESLDVIEVQDLREPLVIVKKGDVIYGALLPNHQERD